MKLKTPPSHFNYLIRASIFKLKEVPFTTEYFANYISKFSVNHPILFRQMLGIITSDTPSRLLAWLLRERYVEKKNDNLYQFTTDANRLIA